MVNLNLNKVWPGSHKLPKICVFGINKNFLLQKLTEIVLNVPRAGGVTGLGLSP